MKLYSESIVVSEGDFDIEDGGDYMEFAVESDSSQCLYFKVCSSDESDLDIKHSDFKSLIGKKITIIVEVDEDA